MTQTENKSTAHYHLPGLFEFYELYKVFLPLWREHRDWFYDWCDISSIYGAPADCLWGGGRAGFGEADGTDVLSLMKEYGISARLTFSNSLLKEEHLADKKCNELCRMFSKADEQKGRGVEACKAIRNAVIVHSDLLADLHKSRKIRRNFFVTNAVILVV